MRIHKTQGFSGLQVTLENSFNHSEYAEITYQGRIVGRMVLGKAQTTPRQERMLECEYIEGEPFVYYKGIGIIADKIEVNGKVVVQFNGREWMPVE